MEMGGYLPIELVKGSGWFSTVPQDKCWALNTGRTALWAATMNLQPEKVFIPYYYCPDVIEMFQSLPVKVCFYRINENLLPRTEDLYSYTQRDCLLLVDYFGILSSELLPYTELYPRIIFDFCHSFYTTPVMKEGVLNVYSCRKFFGVSDGAYLIGETLKKSELERDYSSDRASHLLISLEKGTNYAYQENKANEEKIGKSHLTMSLLTEAILNGVDYTHVASSRKENYTFLQKCLVSLSRLPLPTREDITPYCFPLLLNRDIHAQLVDRKIYTPYLWKWLLEDKWNGTIEQDLSRNLLPLPLDQRYRSDQLQWMCDQILAILAKE